MKIKFENDAIEPYEYEVFRLLADHSREPLECLEPDQYVIIGDALVCFLDRTQAPPDKPIWGEPCFWNIAHTRSGRIIAGRLNRDNAVLCALKLWPLYDWQNLDEEAASSVPLNKGFADELRGIVQPYQIASATGAAVAPVSRGSEE